MANQPLWFVGNQNPSITETITINKAAVDLTGATVKFRMRALGSSTLKVDAAATVVAPATAGNVRYDWQTADVDTAGHYLCWWQVTSAGKTQDVAESVIEFRAHSVASPNAYIEVEELKATGELTGQGFADADLQRAIAAATRGVEMMCNRRFWLDPDANQVRYFTPKRADSVAIGDLVTFTSLRTDTTGSGNYDTVWVQNSDFVLEPLNNVAEGLGRPYTLIRVHPLGSNFLFWPWPRSVQLTGQFGWAQVPDPVKQATSILATKLLKRSREAPFGIVSLGLEGAAVRIGKSDPDIGFLLEQYVRQPLIV